jgi:CHRD domain
MHVKAIAAAAALFCFGAGAAHAALFDVSATLKGAGEKPASATSGAGTLTGELDTGDKAFSYEVNYSGLSGPVTAAHFQGAVAPGSSDQPIIAGQALTNPIEGTTTLTNDQVSSLEAGKWSLNLNTAAHPTGEIAGQLQATRREAPDNTIQLN